MDNRKPVLYLDIDDTLLQFPAKGPSWLCQTAGLHARDFLEWASQHFEIRPLTMWAMRGRFKDGTEIADLLGMGKEWWESLQGRPHSQGPGSDKIDGLFLVDDAREGRDWVWMEDDLLPRERGFLREKGLLHHYLRCNVSQNPTAISSCWAALMAFLMETDTAKKYDVLHQTFATHQTYTQRLR